jgi:hypothetical protein
MDGCDGRGSGPLTSFFDLISAVYALAMAPHPIEYLFLLFCWYAVCHFIGRDMIRRDAQRYLSRKPDDDRLPGPLPRRWSRRQL